MKKIKGMFVLLFVSLTLSSTTVSAKDIVFSTEPINHVHNVEKARIAYYQGGDYSDYYDCLLSTIQGLIALGWIEEIELPLFTEKDSKVLWHWLAANVESKHLQFIDDAYYSVDWDAEMRSQLRGDFLRRLNSSQDIDLVFAMGTWAGKDLANNLHNTPVIIMSASDPLRAGVIQSLEDSGYEHVFASIDPRLYEQQVQLFHQLIGFKKLGVPYENTVDGRSYAAIELIEKTAQESGFEIVSCYTQSDIADQNLAGDSVIKCFEDLVQRVDAIYVTVQGGVNADTIPELVKIANQYGIPTFSQNGEEGVRYGYLLSLSRGAGFKTEGLFLAENIGRIVNGATPRDLPQVFYDSFNIILNMKTAQEIGLYINADVLAAADKLYWKIEQPER